MTTECIQQGLKFQDHGRRKTVVKCDGEVTSSDGGLVLLREIENKHRIIDRLQKCFTDKRKPKKIIHSL